MTQADDPDDVGTDVPGPPDPGATETPWPDEVAPDAVAEGDSEWASDWPAEDHLDGERDATDTHDVVAGDPDAVDAGWYDDDPALEGDYVYVPDDRSIWRRAGTVAVLFFVVLGIAAGGAGLWVRGKLEPSGPQESVEFSIPQAATTAQIARQLEEREIISDATIFRYYVRWRDAGPFQAGVYDGLTTNSAMHAVVDVLEAGPQAPSYTDLTIPEGLWLSEIRERVLEAYPEMHPDEWDAAVQRVRSRYQPEGASLEGFLFPATYRVLDEHRHDAQRLVEEMVTTFDRVADEEGLGDATARLEGAAGSRPITPFEALVVASMIESETRIPEEKPMVARVIYNRLLRDMRLDIDATVLYAIGERVETLTQSQLDTDSPYNTRASFGIPPGPIAAPGRDSIAAALAPAEGDWLFYVLAEEDGRHFFTNNYDEFLRVADESRARGLFE
ncbi:MAG: endolytic transglycosylase MltG [Acidimicrobiia bacterium]|nr:endolytic transglycosylase MltG [Acidimicrobiia bacterium]